MKSQGKSSCGKFKEKALVIDSFGTHFTFMLPNGQKKYNTFFGCCFTLLYFAILGAFIFFVTMGLIELDKNMMTRITTRDTLEAPTATIMNVVGFKVIDPKSKEYVLPSSVATLKAYLRNWDFDEAADNFTEEPNLIPMPAADCTFEQFMEFWPTATEDEFIAREQATGGIENSAGMQCLGKQGVRGNSD